MRALTPKRAVELLAGRALDTLDLERHGLRVDPDSAASTLARPRG